MSEPSEFRDRVHYVMATSTYEHLPTVLCADIGRLFELVHALEDKLDKMKEALDYKPPPAHFGVHP